MLISAPGETMLNLGSKTSMPWTTRYSPGRVKPVWLSYCPTWFLLKWRVQILNYSSSNKFMTFLSIRWKYLPSSYLLVCASDNEICIVHCNEISCKLAWEMVLVFIFPPVQVRIWIFCFLQSMSDVALFTNWSFEQQRSKRWKRRVTLFRFKDN